MRIIKFKFFVNLRCSINIVYNNRTIIYRHDHNIIIIMKDQTK